MKIFRADAYHKSIHTIDFRGWHEKGYRGLLFDIDNTLVPHGAGATPEVERFLFKLQEMGFRIGLISNNDKERVQRFNRNLNLDYVCNAGKPKPGNFKRLIHQMGLIRREVIFIGDQIFTDLLGANLAGLTSILVRPMDPHEPAQIIFKRKLEGLLIRNRCFI